MSLSDFVTAYVEAALWTSTDDDGNPLDANYSADDFAPEAMEKIRNQCGAFHEEHAEKWEGAYHASPCTDDQLAGHDFWLTRNGHGCGFWSRGLGELGEKLTKASRWWGECDIYIGDDGRLYL